MVDLNEFTAEQLRDEVLARAPLANRREFVVDCPGRRDALLSVPDQDLLRALLRQQKLIYGVNARIEAREATGPERAAAAAVAAILPAHCLIPVSKDACELELPTHKERVEAYFGCRLGESEPFSEQPSGALFSGCLVAPDLVLTVGRLVSRQALPGLRFVFGFEIQSNDGARRASRDDIYAGIEIVDTEFDPQGEDWALVRLDRPVSGRHPARVRRLGALLPHGPLHVIGHPLGLPLKVAAGGAVRATPVAETFVANVDAYGGGPGSPVFNSETHEVEGLLVRGGAELVRLGERVFSLICPPLGCLGSLCVRAALVPLPDDEFITLRMRRPHMRGDRVRSCQTRLGLHGFDVPVDGVYGPKTRAAVRAFQRREGLTPNGVVDEPTHALLHS